MEEYYFEIDTDTFWYVLNGKVKAIVNTWENLTKLSKYNTPEEVYASCKVVHKMKL